MSGFYPTENVREAARGNWVAILAALMPDIEPALKKAGKGHVQCPMPHHNSKGKNFRVFKDVNETGGAICSNTCGSWKEGFNLLMDYHGWSFEEAKNAIGEFLGLEKIVPRAQREAARKAPAAKLANKPAQARKAGSKVAAKAIGHTAPQNQADQSESMRVSDAEKSSVMSFDEAMRIEAELKGHKVQADSVQAENASTLEEVEEALNDAYTVEQPEKQATKLNIHDFHQSKPWLRATLEELEEQRKRDELYQEHLKEHIASLWEKALPLSAEAAGPARAYLANRMLTVRGINVDDTLRFDPYLPYRDEDGNMVGKYPAILAAIRSPEGELITLHRTYLTSTGKKARVPNAKKMMSVPNDREVVGGAIRLGEMLNGVVGVAEGMETALSAYRATGIPTWSAVSASILQGFIPPEGTKVVINWADKDRSLAGDHAAKVLTERLKELGITVISLFPSVPIPPRAKGVDWNDVLIGQGLFGFPRRADLNAMIKNAFTLNGQRHAV